MTKEKEKEDESTLSLEFGDVVRLQIDDVSASLGTVPLVIVYVSDDTIQAVPTDGTQQLVTIDMHQLRRIVLLERAAVRGVARQQGLVPGTWFRLIPETDPKTAVTARVTNLHEDCIECQREGRTTLFYIDFAYRGMPPLLREHKVRIERIEELPLPLPLPLSLRIEEGKADEGIGTATMEYLDNGEIVLRDLDRTRGEPSVLDRLEELYRLAAQDDVTSTSRVPLITRPKVREEDKDKDQVKDQVKEHAFRLWCVQGEGERERGEGEQEQQEQQEQEEQEDVDSVVVYPSFFVPATEMVWLPTTPIKERAAMAASFFPIFEARHQEDASLVPLPLLDHRQPCLDVAVPHERWFDPPLPYTRIVEQLLQTPFSSSSLNSSSISSWKWWFQRVVNRAVWREWSFRALYEYVHHGPWSPLPPITLREYLQQRLQVPNTNNNKNHQNNNTNKKITAIDKEDNAQLARLLFSKAKGKEGKGEEEGEEKGEGEGPSQRLVAHYKHQPPEQLDGATYVALLLQYCNEALWLPESLLDAVLFSTATGNTMPDELTPLPTHTLVLAKEYTTLTALEKDNVLDTLWFDKRLDKTPYPLMARYKVQRDEMLPETFRLFLKETLVQRHGCPDDHVDELVEVLLTGKREVRDGHYAVLRLEGEGEKGKEKEPLRLFYRRLRHRWVRDTEVKEEQFTPVHELVDQLGARTPATLDTAMLRMKRNHVLAEVRRRYALHAEDQKTQLAVQLVQQQAKVQRLRAYVQRQATKRSQYVSLFTDVSAQVLVPSSSSSSSSSSCRLRAPVSYWNESPHWYYDADTNVRARSKAQCELTPSNFIATARTCGSVLDGRVFCRHSGILLGPVPRYQTNAGTKTEPKPKTETKNKVLSTLSQRKTRVLFSYYRTLCQRLALPKHCARYRNRVLAWTLALLPACLVPSRDYKERRKKMSSLPPYAVYKEDVAVRLVALLFLVMVQTAELPCPTHLQGFPLTPAAASTPSSLAAVVDVLLHVPWRAMKRYDAPTLRDSMVRLWQVLRPHMAALLPPKRPLRSVQEEYTSFVRPARLDQCPKHVVAPLSPLFATTLAQAMQDGNGTLQHQLVATLESHGERLTWYLLHVLQQTLARGPVTPTMVHPWSSSEARQDLVATFRQVVHTVQCQRRVAQVTVLSTAISTATSTATSTETKSKKEDNRNTEELVFRWYAKARQALFVSSSERALLPPNLGDLPLGPFDEQVAWLRANGIQADVAKWRQWQQQQAVRVVPKRHAVSKTGFENFLRHLERQFHDADALLSPRFLQCWQQAVAHPVDDTITTLARYLALSNRRLAHHVATQMRDRLGAASTRFVDTWCLYKSPLSLSAWFGFLRRLAFSFSSFSSTSSFSSSFSSCRDVTTFLDTIPYHEAWTTPVLVPCLQHVLWSFAMHVIGSKEGHEGQEEGEEEKEGDEDDLVPMVADDASVTFATCGVDEARRLRRRKVCLWLEQQAIEYDKEEEEARKPGKEQREEEEGQEQEQEEQEQEEKIGFE